MVKFIASATLLGRLAVDTKQRGKMVGTLLLLDALRRCLRSEVASLAVIVDTKNNAAISFYEWHEFHRPTPRVGSNVMQRGLRFCRGRAKRQTAPSDRAGAPRRERRRSYCWSHAPPEQLARAEGFHWPPVLRRGPPPSKPPLPRADRDGAELGRVSPFSYCCSRNWPGGIRPLTCHS